MFFPNFYGSNWKIKVGLSSGDVAIWWASQVEH